MIEVYVIIYPIKNSFHTIDTFINDDNILQEVEGSLFPISIGCFYFDCHRYINISESFIFKHMSIIYGWIKRWNYSYAVN